MPKPSPFDELPPTQKGRHHELRGLALREFAGVKRDTDPIDPFDIANAAKLLVAPFDVVEPLLTDETRKHLLGDASEAWSGGAASQVLPDGRKLIILNPTHSQNRQKATLMEEISHLFLGHRPSKLAVERRNEKGEIIARDYNRSIEEEAYSTGAAALVPYSGLKKMVSAGRSAAWIARAYGVSRSLVEFRIKISRLWDEYKSHHNDA